MRQLIYLALALACVTVSSAYGQTDAYIPSRGDDQVVRVTASEDPEVIDAVALEGAPYGAAVLPDNSYVVVTREDGDLATAIPLDDFNTTGSRADIDVGDQPRGVAVESRGNYAYVANYGDGTVTRIYTPTWTVSSTIDLANELSVASDAVGPWGVAASYDEVASTPRVYVANHLADSIAVITNGGVEIIESAKVGDGPLGLALTPDGRYLIVALYYDDAVAVIDTDSLSRETTLSVGDAPWGVAVGGDGAYAYVTNSGSDTVSVIDTTTWSVVATYATGDEPLGVAAPVNGDYAYVVNRTGDSITRISHPAATLETIGSGDIDGAYALGAFFGADPPTAPSDLSAKADSASKIELTWTDNADDEEGFKIEQRKDGEEAFTQVAKVNADVIAYTRSGLERDTTYDFRVRAYVAAADSEYSGEATATTTDEKFSWCFIGCLLEGR
jgi:YVTN family beta-propeller protein